MKKFKLIKTYPNNPELGVEVVYSEMYNNYFPVGGSYNDQRTKNEVENYPEFWEEVVEKNYEIISLVSTLPSKLVITYHEGGGCYKIGELERVYKSKDKWLEAFAEKNKNLWKIHSIKRLSDGEIFTVGDKVCWDWSTSSVDYFIIDALRLSFDKSEIILEFKNKNVFEGLFNDIKFNFRHYKESQPLFTTKDGVDVFEGDSYFLVTNDFKKAFCSFYSESDLTFKLFSDGEKAEEYIKMNRPEYSRNDIINLLDKLNKDEI